MGNEQLKIPSFRRGVCDLCNKQCYIVRCEKSVLIYENMNGVKDWVTVHIDCLNEAIGRKEVMLGVVEG